MKTISTILCITFMLVLSSINNVHAQADAEEVMATLTEMLDLSDTQQEQVGGLLVKYRGNMDQILTKYEGQEEPDVGAMIGEIRGVRDSYRKELQGVLSPNQYETYLAGINDVLTAMFNDLAEIRLMDLATEAELTDKQIEQLTPIVGKSLLQTVKLLFENAGTRLSLPKKISLGKQLKKFEKEKRDGMEKILTPDQMALYDKWKEEQKNKK